LIADDHRSVLKALVRLLEDEFEVVGAVRNGHRLVEAAKRLRPDVIVTDIWMPGLNGLKALERLKGEVSEVKVIILTVDVDSALAAEAIRSGASGFVVKFSAADELEFAITEVLQGRTYLSPAVATAALLLGEP
jgi:DNA-binding NarL/FixJ family response regulator